jgi:glycosyltransferase involved in cell wall biosynthesis
LAAIARYTTTPHELVVADDGSTDDTGALLRRMRTPHVHGSNRGIAWNKNRLLYCLREIRRCDVMILIEDDTVPCAPGWERVWIDAAGRWGHANLAASGLDEGFISGSGSAADPLVSNLVSGQCAVFSRKALMAVGYMDTRFRRYGYEHTEHSYRLLRAGFGGLTEPNRFYLVRSDLTIRPVESSMTEEDLAANREIQHRVVGHDTTLYRHPWRSPEERATLQLEMLQARFLKGGRLATGRRLAQLRVRGWQLERMGRLALRGG